LALLLRALPIGRARLRRLSRTVLLAGLLLPGSGWNARLLRRAILSRQSVLPLRTCLTRRVAAVRVEPAGIGAAEGALLGDDLAADGLRGVDLTHKSLVARDLSR
jgi:hypothetical protein